MAERDVLKAWFCREVLPLEPSLMRYLRRNWRNEADIAELRQDIYCKVFEGAGSAIPMNPRAYVFSVARNHLINCARRARIVSFDLVAELEGAALPVDYLTPERTYTAREELGRVQAGLDQLPPRCREVLVLRRIEGLSQKEAADRMGVSVATIDQQLMLGMRALADFMLGGAGRIKPSARRGRKQVNQA